MSVLMTELIDYSDILKSFKKWCYQIPLLLFFKIYKPGLVFRCCTFMRAQF